MTLGTQENFSTNDGVTAKPRIRWWLPGTRITHETLTRQLESVRDAGFGGVEVAFLGNGGGKPGLEDADKWGDADGKWKRMVQFIWAECERLGLAADLTIGPAFPAMVPRLFPDAPGAAKELVYGISTPYNPGHAIPLEDLPVPTWKEAGRTPANPEGQSAKLHVIAVYAVRVAVDFQGAVQKDDGSMVIAAEEGRFGDAVIDITAQANDQRSFTPPLDSQGVEEIRWVLLAVYYRGTLQSKSHFEQNADTYTQDLAHVVDHLSVDGVNVLAAYYQEHILDDELMCSFKRLKSSLFEDSLELSQTQYWTPALLAEFSARRGYVLTPYLPLILDEPKHHPFAPPFKTFKLGTTSTSARTLQDRVRYDFALTVSDLFLEKRLDPLKKWSNSIGLALRNQPYGIDFDAAVAATKVDIVEGETLCFWGNDDSFRVLATGRDVGGGRILSEELGASMHKHYAMGWHDIIRMANRDFALGVNQVIMHGMPYPDTDHSEWPGYMPFMPAGRLPGFGDAWGDRQPQWTLSSGYTRYLQNVQETMQKGRAIVDLAIYHGAVEGVKGGLKSTALTEAGYTYGFPSDGLLEREGAVVKDGKLWADGPGYRALILNEVSFIPPSTLLRILDLAKQGLPILFVGKTPVTTAGVGTNDTVIKNLVEDILTQDGSTKVGFIEEVATVLRGLNIQSSVRCEDAQNPFLTACRDDGSARFYYIHNTSESATSTALTFNAPGYTSPAFLSLWDRAQPVPAGELAGGQPLRVTISLPAKASTVVRFTKSSEGATSQRDTKSESQPETIVSRVEIQPWRLELESWEPPSTGSAKSTEIHLQRKQFDLQGTLPGWQDIESLQDVSGTATYRATFERPIVAAGQQSRVVLEFDPVPDAHEWLLNGVPIRGSDRLSSHLDITSHLQDGRNRLEITIGTTLNNRMKQVYPEMFKERPFQRHGLQGPVRLVVYSRD